MSNNKTWVCCFCNTPLHEDDIVLADYTGDTKAPPDRKTTWCVPCLPAEHIDKDALAAEACAALVKIMHEARLGESDALGADDRRSFEEIANEAASVFSDMPMLDDRQGDE